MVVWEDGGGDSASYPIRKTTVSLLTQGNQFALRGSATDGLLCL